MANTAGIKKLKEYLSTDEYFQDAATSPDFESRLEDATSREKLFQAMREKELTDMTLPEFNTGLGFSATTPAIPQVQYNPEIDLLDPYKIGLSTVSFGKGKDLDQQKAIEYLQKLDYNDVISRQYEYFNKNRSQFDGKDDYSKVKLPPVLQDYYNKNAKPREVKYEGNMGVIHTATVKGNPDLLNSLKDFLVNTEMGRNYMKEYEKSIDALNAEITPLIAEGARAKEEAIGKNMQSYESMNWVPRSPSSPLSMQPAAASMVDKDVALMNKSLKILKDAQRRIDAYKKGGGFGKGIHLSQEDVQEFTTFSESFNDYVLNTVIDKYEKDPQSLTPAEDIAIKAKYFSDQAMQLVDPGSWYNIGATTKQSAAFMRDYIVTAGIGSAASAGFKKTLRAITPDILQRAGGLIGSRFPSVAKWGTRGLNAAVDLSVRPAVQTILSPSSHSMALQEMQGIATARDENGNITFENRETSYPNALVTPFFENQSEVMGEVLFNKVAQRLHIPGLRFMRNPAARRMSAATGIQGPIIEYAEEKYMDAIEMMRGRETVEEFFDPRRNSETFGAVAVMQIPFTAINTVGYLAGKRNDFVQKSHAKKVYNAALNNMSRVFGNEAESAIAELNRIEESHKGEAFNLGLVGFSGYDKFTDEQKIALIDYAIAWKKYSGMQKAKAEQVEQAQQEAIETVKSNINPDMNAVVSAIVAGKQRQITAGNVKWLEDGSVDRENSDRQVVYLDDEGVKQVAPIDLVEKLLESVPAEEALRQAGEIAAAPVIAQQENEEVRPYEEGEKVRLNNGLTGEIAGINEDGTYRFAFATPNAGIQEMNIEPRQILDNLTGIDNGSIVDYRDASGNIVSGEVDNAALFGNGIFVIDGEEIPVADVIGLHREETPNPQYANASNEQLAAHLADIDNALRSGQFNEQQMAEAITERDSIIQELESRKNQEENNSASQENPEQRKRGENPEADVVEDIEKTFAALGGAVEADGITAAAERIDKSGPFTMRNPEAVAKAKENPRYNVVENPDGTVTVTGILDMDNRWHGQARETDSRAEEEKRLFYESLPKNKKGEMDENAMTDTQKLQHLEYKRGKEFTVNAARKSRQNTEKEIEKLQKRLDSESDPMKLDKIQDQIDFLSERVRVYDDYITSYQKEKMLENMKLSGQMQAQRTEQERLLEEEKRKNAEQAELEALEKERAEGIPDVSRDKAVDARRRGYRIQEGNRIDRQEEMSNINGVPVTRKFSDTETVNAIRTVADANGLQASHKNGARNNRFFITEAQPKERTDDASRISAENIAKNINPQEITGGTTAYSGSPIVNTRGEVIQGNNRTVALQQMYEQFPEQAAKYRQYLAEHAEEYGMSAEDIMNMERPVAVDVISVSDEKAIQLGQLNAADTESGGIQRIPPGQTAQRLGEKQGRFSEILFENNTGEDMSIGELISKNAGRAMDYLISTGAINNTQYQSAFDKRQNLTAEAKADLTGIATQTLFNGASDLFAQRFDRLPAKAKAAILQTIHRDNRSDPESKITDDIRQAVEAYSLLSQNADFVNARTEEETRRAVWAWSRQIYMDFTEGNFIPSERFNNFALELAIRFHSQTMALQRQTFNALYDNLQGVGDIFNPAEKSGKKEAIRKQFNIDYNGNELQGSHALADNNRDGSTGQPGSVNEPPGREQHTQGEQSPDSGGRIERDNRKREQEVSTSSQEEAQEESTDAEEQNPPQEKPVEERLADAGGDIISFAENETKRNEIAEKDNTRFQSEQSEDLEAVNEQFNEELNNFKAGKLKSSEVLHLGKPLEILQASGLKSGEMTITQRTLTDHLKAHNLTTEDLKGLAKAIQSPILVYNWGKNNPATTIVTEMTLADGRRIAVGIRLNNKGNDMSVNEIATIHGKTNNHLLEDFQKATPEELHDEKLKWVEKEKVLNWLGMVPPKGTTQADEALNSIANVIQNFENPKLPAEKLQSSDKKLQSIPAKAWQKLIEWLQKTGLAMNVFIDEARMREYLENHSETRKQSVPVVEDATKAQSPVDNTLIDAAKDYFGTTGNFNEAGYLLPDGTMLDFSGKKDGARGGYRTEDHRAISNIGDDVDMVSFMAMGNIRLLPESGGFEITGMPTGAQRRTLHRYIRKFGGDVMVDFSTPGDYNIEHSAEYYEASTDRVINDIINYYRNGIKPITGLRRMSTPKGEVYGFVTPEGDVYLDPKRMNANTPIHEFGHLWNSFIKENNPELWEKGKKLIKSSPYWDKVNSNPAYSALSEDEKADEALAMAVGDKGEAMVRSGNVIGVARLRTWLNDLWNWVAEHLGIRNLNAGQIENLTLDEFVNGEIADLLSGEEISSSRSRENDTARVQAETAYANQENYDFDVSGITEANAQEMQRIKTESQKNGTFMKAPNGNETKLNERQWLQVRTEAFKKWFGDWENKPENASKVIDENGEPRKFTHETNNKFSVFKSNFGTLGKGIYFLPYNPRKKIQWYGKNNTNVFLRIKNPIRKDKTFEETGYHYGSIGADEMLRKKGFDGIISEDGYFGETVAFSPDQIKSASDNNGNFDEGSDDIRYQFIGEKGAAALDKAEEATTRLDNLAVARQMETAKKDAKAIKLATGWERGADGKWRYEIPDLEIKHSLIEAIDDTDNTEGYGYVLSDGGGKLVDFIDADKLFTAYPQLKNISVLYDDYLDASAKYIPKEKTIKLGENLDMSSDSFRSLLVHEIQHAIQDIEGFAEGSNEGQFTDPTALSLAYKDFDANVKKLSGDKYENIGHVLHDERFSGYRDVFAKDVSMGQFLLDGMRNMYRDTDKDVFMANYEDFVESGKKGTAYRQYFRTAGEVEARNVSRRMDMTPEERSASLAAETEDVAREDQIFLYDSLGKNMMESETGERNNSLPLQNIMNKNGEINYGELNKQTNSILDGTIRINALSLAEEQGRTRGGRRNVEASLLLRGSVGTDGSQQGDTRERQEKILKEYAQHEGIWISPEVVEGWKPVSEDVTMEARVYSDGDSVIKVGYNYLNFYDTPLDWLTNKVSLNNYIFPDTGLELIGFTETYGATRDVPGVFFAPVYKQKYVKGRVLSGNESSLLEEEMKRRGFTKKGYSSYYNDNYIIRDLHVDNVMITEGGNYCLVDTVPYLNTPDEKLDGIREYGDYSVVENQESSEASTRFQVIPTGNPTPQLEATRNELDAKINTVAFRLREAWEDRYLAVKKFLDILREKGVAIKDYNDFYLQATHLAGKNDAQLEFYNNRYQKPLNEAINKLEKKGFSLRDIENYAILKHGLERNEYMTQKDINEGKEPRDDYSGVLTVEKETGKSAQDYIAGFEAQAEAGLISELWQRTNEATQFSLSKQLDSGLIDKKLFDELTARYKYYLPLRGHDAQTAEDIWRYMGEMGTHFSSPLVRADGRTSRSETPFAYIAQMAQSAIVSANKNELNQTLLRLARIDSTGLLTANRTWYVNGVAQEAEYSENADTYRENIEKFEAEMADLGKKGLAKRKKGRLNIGDMFIKDRQKKEHAVRVFQNGKSYTVYINGNPAVSQAVNGTNVKEHDASKIAEATRWMAANMTTRNPLFVLSNFSRDYLFSSSILGVKEDAKYALQFQGNIPKASAALYRYLAGKPDMNKKEDRYMLEYITNGAKTGFSHIVNLQKIQKQVERDIKNGNSKNMFRHLGDAIGNMNDFAENLSRFSVYVTSRKAGRSVQRSVSDAKNVTVNFNQQGAGGYGASWIRPLYLFVNAGIQALSNFSKIAVQHPWKTTALITVYSATGSILAPLIAALIGGDDGEDEYWRLPDWDRQNNLCIYTGKGFIKIPLPHELRVFHALGDNIAQALSGRKTGGDAFLDSLLSLTDLIPTNPAGSAVATSRDLINKGGSEAAKTALSMLSPDVAKPVVQLAVNRDFKEMPVINQWAKNTSPGYKRIRINKKGEAYAPQFLVDFARFSDNVTGGDGVKKGLVSFNPDEVQHITEGYFGGLYTTISQTVDMIYKGVLPDKEVKVRDTPFRRFYVPVDDIAPIGQGMNSKYRHIRDKVTKDKDLMKGYRDEAGKVAKEIARLRSDVENGKLDIVEFARKQTELNNRINKYEEEFNRMGTEKHYELKAYINEIEKREKRLRELEGQEQKDREIETAGLKRKVIEMSDGE